MVIRIGMSVQFLRVIVSLSLGLCFTGWCQIEAILHQSNIEGKRGTSFCPHFAGIVPEGGKATHRSEEESLPKDGGKLYPIGSRQGPGEEVRTCLRKCCQTGEILGTGDRPNCSRLSDGLIAPDLVLEDARLAKGIRGTVGISDRFALVESMACPENTSKYILEPEMYEEDDFVLESNGTIRTGGLVTFPPWLYCLDWKESFERIGVLVCIPTDVQLPPATVEATYNVGIMVSIPFLFVTFLVYAIIPELRNLYGKTLMCYVACLVVAYSFLVVAKLFYFRFAVCSAIAFTIHFSFLASFFWLNVMCFDIWWTFGGFRSLQGSVKQRERKKFIIYSIYAWGAATILTGVCIIVEFVPGIPEHFIKPQFGAESCWFTTDVARAVYFYGPMGVTVFCNICLFVSTALKILRHKKDTAHHLKGTDSRRHDDNKQWFNLYLKLFIVMGINWSMEIVSWLCENSPEYIWYITDLTNTLQGVIIFLIFVWKDKIKRLLLKKFGCQDRGVLSRNSTRSVYHSSASRTCTTFATPLQEKINPYSTNEAPYRPRGVSDDSDCP